MKDVLTTGEVARLCGVAPRTVSKWFDTGQLRGFKIPGSRDRRIPRESLIRFMRAHQIPLRGLDGAMTRVLVADSHYEAADGLRAALDHTGHYDVRVSTGVFESGLAAHQFRPHVILLDVHLPGLDPAQMRQALRADPDLVATRVVAVERDLAPERVRQRLREGFDACVGRPYDIRSIIATIEDATDLVS